MLFQATSKLEWLECGEKSRSFTKSRDSFRFRCLTARGKAILGLVETTLNIRAFGTGSVEVLSLLNGYLTLPTIVDKFQEANIAVNSIGSVMDLTDLIDGSRYVEEAAIDLTVSYDRDAICNPGWFETVFIEGKLTEKGTDHVIASGVHFEANINIEKENE